MDTVLLILGVLGLGAMVIAAYVFTVSARNYVSEDNFQDSTASKAYTPSTEPVARSGLDRRKQKTNSFPITVNGVLIEDDRRVFPDRRFVA